MGPPALLPIRKESVLRIFIAFKNTSPWPGSNRNLWIQWSIILYCTRRKTFCDCSPVVAVLVVVSHSDSAAMILQYPHVTRIMQVTL
jgi:hypothetical protein